MMENFYDRKSCDRKIFITISAEFFLKGSECVGDTI